MQGQESLPNSPGSPSKSGPGQESSPQRPTMPQSPYAAPEDGQGEGTAQQNSTEARSEQPQGGQGGAQGQPLPQSMSAPLGRTDAGASGGTTVSTVLPWSSCLSKMLTISIRLDAASFTGLAARMHPCMALPESLREIIQ